MSFVLSIDDDDTGWDHIELPPEVDERHARSLFGVTLLIVTRPGSKREGDAVAIRLTAPDGTIVEEYRRTAHGG